jgi:hypothetical protein
MTRFVSRNFGIDSWMEALPNVFAIKIEIPAIHAEVLRF